MKKDAIMPTWEDSFSVVVRSELQKRFVPVMERANEADLIGRLSLRATLEIDGGDVNEWICVDHRDSAAVEKAMLLADRRAAWARGVSLAKFMLKNDLLGQFVVSWEPETETTREAVMVYELMPIDDDYWDNCAREDAM